MFISRSKISGAAVALSLSLMACGSDDDGGGKNNPSSGGGGTGGGAGGSGGSTGGTAGSSGSGGSTGGSGGSTGGTAGTGGSTGGAGGTGGVPACDLSGAGKTKEKIPLTISADTTLTADKVWTLSDAVHVASGATLTIEPCTRIEGTKTPIGVLIVARGAKINAAGTENAPILFTSPQPVGSRAPGDWGGVILLGKATTNDGTPLVEGLPDVPDNHFGGTDDADDSGTMTYVRIEYGGYQLATDNEVNGLTLGGVGSGTTINHIMVSNTLDDCFEWFGGTVNVDHLICNSDGDDMFDTDKGYRGTMTHLFGRKLANPSANPNGFEWDGHPTNFTATPNNKPMPKKVTMCGFGADVGVASYGMVLRRGSKGLLEDIVVTGFDHGFDMRDDVGTLAAPAYTMTNSTFFGQLKNDIANASETNNDNGFDETAWFNAGAGNGTASAGFTATDCVAAAGPTAAVTGSGKGAFKDGNWLTGAWIDWASK
ncbi:MAG: hypothetical protein U0263_24345 [Polyangiaceae bacterium]